MFKATTVLAVHSGKEVAMAGDGQVTFGDTVVKHGAKKIRRLYNNRVLAGFAGAVADAFTLFSLFEEKLDEYDGQLVRAAVELAKEWRTDRRLRQLEALLLVADQGHLLMVSGSGEVIEPDDGIAAIGSGGSYALAAARALKAHSPLTVGQIAMEALKIAAKICIYTNEEIYLEELGGGVMDV